jgi:hypothetical protein
VAIIILIFQCLMLCVKCFIEPEAFYTFLKPLSKKTDGFTKHETMMECTVSSSMAMVSWWRGDKRISVCKTFITLQLVAFC